MPARKKRAPKKKTKNRPHQTGSKKSPKPALIDELKKIFAGIAILVSLCLTLAMIADILLHPGHQDQKTRPPKKTVIHKNLKKPVIKPIQEGISEKIKNKKSLSGLKEKQSKSPAIKYEVFKDIDHTIIPKPPVRTRPKIPRIAIIIDDIGYDKKIAAALWNLDHNITFSVLPFSPFGRYICEQLHSKGAQIMLHLPMEPVEYPHVNPGPGAIFSTMPPDALLDQLKKDIKAVPYIEGVNNHMGSRLTTDSARMNQIFTILKKDNLFFIDSRTSAKSQCRASAGLLKIRFAQRNVFLDNFQDIDYISGQFSKLVRLAKKHGSAIGIGHPYKATLKSLSKNLPGLDKNHVKLVRAGRLTVVPE
jgi:polysaccharide deacetylase 2 family uncharacterized protein YibQ